jgi:hypothetical protein
MDNATVNFINKQLVRYGRNTYNDPIFRVVFCDEQTEKRHGTYNDYHGKVFYRTITETREVQKYPWMNERWILERWAPGAISSHPSLVADKDGVFVCVYIFQDKDKNALPPILRVCDIVIHNLLNPRMPGHAMSQDRTIFEEEENQEVDKMLEVIKIDYDETQTEAETSSISLFDETKKKKKEVIQ